MDQLDIPGYRIQGELGRGARGIVYRARRGEVTYAIKVQNSDEDRSLLSYGATLACVRHPGLPEVIEVGEYAGRPYLVREFVAGHTLASELDTGPMDEPRVLEIAKTLAGALDEVHRHGLIHRDVKPANILLSRTGGARLIDFGFATQIKASRDSTVGTYLYSAPEQTGTLDAPMDQRTDLYALGGVLFRAASGQPPYNSNDAAELLRLHAAAPVPRVRDLNPEISLALDAIIRKLLAKDPADRYQTGKSLLADLRVVDKLNRRIELGEELKLGEHGRELGTKGPPLVGRDTELEELVNALESVRHGQGESILIEGGGGAGKSVLSGEFLKRASSFRPLVLEAQCLQGGRPFAPVKDCIENFFKEKALLPKVQRERIEEELKRFGVEVGQYLTKLGPESAAFFGGNETAINKDEASDQFLEAAADFIVELARLHGCAIWTLEDAHFLDEASHQVLRRVRSRLDDAPLMVLATARNSPEAEIGLELYIGTAEPSVRLPLEPLAQAELELLAFALLGSRPVNSEVVRQVSLRSHGNPFAATEYIRAMLASGVLLPTIEGWTIDHRGIQNLSLPEDILELVLQRVGALPEGVHTLLSIASIIGNRFSLKALAAVEKKEEKELRVYLDQAARQHVVEEPQPGVFHFVHDRIHEAFLSEIRPTQRRLLHLRVAQGLEALSQSEPELCYAVARHYSLGEGRDIRDRVYETNLAAGHLALSEFAFEDAYNFLEQAAHSSGGEHNDWMEPLSEACQRTGRVERAMELLEKLLAGSPPALSKSRYLIRLAQLRQSKLDRTRALDGCRQALAAIGKPVLEHPVLDVFLMLYYFLLWLIADWTGVARGGAKGEARDRERLLAELYKVYSEGCYFGMNYPKMLEMGSRACLAGHWLGLSPQMIVGYANMMVVGGMLRRPKLIENFANRIQADAEELGDPVSLSYCQVLREVAHHIGGGGDEHDRALDRTLTQRGHLLDPWCYLMGIADLAFCLMMRGQVREAWNWVQKGIERCQITSSPVGVARDLDILSCYAISALAVLGRSGDSLSYVERLKVPCNSEETDPSLRANYYAHLLMFHMETKELGQPMVETGEKFLSLKLNPVLCPYHRRHFYVLWAYCWLARCRQQEGQKDLKPLDQALKLLKKSANRPVLRGHYLVALAGRQQLSGQLHQALDTLAEAQKIADLTDAPWITHEVCKGKARVLSELKKYDVAAREAAHAYQLALDCGWPGRARTVAQEFSFGRSVTSAPSGSVTLGKVSKTGPDDTLRLRLERQLEALLNLSLASAKVFGPYDQARAVLDELIRLLSAERAYLFLEHGGGLEFITGRDLLGQTLDAPTGYSQTVIEAVQFSRETVIIAGTEQGEALGAQSVVVHDLRSIICAPFSIRDQFAGLVYLDNRLARGVFNDEDVEILNALLSHIAVAMETAKAARLEVEVESERRQRELADVLSQFTVSLSSTLESDAIFERLVETLSQSIPVVRATIWLHESDDQLRLVSHQGLSKDHKDLTLEPRSHEAFRAVMETQRPVVKNSIHGDPGLEQRPTEKPFSWMAIPMMSDRRVAAVVTLSAQEADVYSDYETEVAFTFCNQAGVALANARLFREIERMATIDALTGAYNRRQFFQSATKQLEHARRLSHPLSVIMLDVDHFKKFNDNFGHATGDEVLRHVSNLCAQTVGEQGTLGRYGGEEFGVCLPRMDLEAACRVAENIRSVVETSPVEDDGRQLSVTLSLGVAQLRAGETLDDVLGRADEALYEAKEKGRNQVCASQAVTT